MSFGFQAEDSPTFEARANQRDARLMLDLYEIIHAPEMEADWAWFTSDFKLDYFIYNPHVLLYSVNSM